MPPANSSVFRWSHRGIQRLAVFATGAMFLVMLGFMAVAIIKGNGLPLTDFAVGLGLSAAFGAVIASLLYFLRWRFPIEITPAGIDGFDLKGHPCFVRWDQLGDCIPFTAYLFVHCVLVRHSAVGQEPLLIPLVLERMAEFRSLVSMHAGVSTGLSKALA